MTGMLGDLEGMELRAPPWELVPGGLSREQRKLLRENPELEEEARIRAYRAMGGRG